MILWFKRQVQLPQRSLTVLAPPPECVCVVSVGVCCIQFWGFFYPSGVVFYSWLGSLKILWKMSHASSLSYTYHLIISWSFKTLSLFLPLSFFLLTSVFVCTVYIKICGVWLTAQSLHLEILWRKCLIVWAVLISTDCFNLQTCIKLLCWE